MCGEGVIYVRHRLGGRGVRQKRDQRLKGAGL